MTISSEAGVVFPAARKEARRAALRVLRQSLAWCAASAGRQRQRRCLRMLDDDLLDDVGLTRAEAMSEAAKPFWR